METRVIYKMAKRIGMSPSCKERMKENFSLPNLCQMYFDGDDWSLENNFPSLEILRNFKGKSDQYGLRTDFKGSLQNEFQAAFFGDSEVEMTYNMFSVGTIILRHNSKAKIKASGNSFLIINILDNAELEIESYDNSSVNVFCYGNYNVKSIGNVKVQTK